MTTPPKGIGMARTSRKTSTSKTKDDTVEGGAQLLDGATNDDSAKSGAESTGKRSVERNDQPKDKAPANSAVAGAWIRAQLEDAPKTKAELIELAAKSNPAKFGNPKGKDRPNVPRSTKWIVENKKLGQMCPGNASGYYIPEGLNPRKGGIEVVFADEEKKTLRIK
jgi:hypothetical protein